MSLHTALDERKVMKANTGVLKLDILEILRADGRPHTTTEIQALFPGEKRSRINSCLKNLTVRGVIERVEHGTYASKPGTQTSLFGTAQPPTETVSQDHTKTAPTGTGLDQVIERYVETTIDGIIRELVEEKVERALRGRL